MRAPGGTMGTLCWGQQLSPGPQGLWAWPPTLIVLCRGVPVLFRASPSHPRGCSALVVPRSCPQLQSLCPGWQTASSRDSFIRDEREHGKAGGSQVSPLSWHVGIVPGVRRYPGAHAWMSSVRSLGNGLVAVQAVPRGTRAPPCATWAQSPAAKIKYAIRIAGKSCKSLLSLSSCHRTLRGVISAGPSCCPLQLAISRCSPLPSAMVGCSGAAEEQHAG